MLVRNFTLNCVKIELTPLVTEEKRVPIIGAGILSMNSESGFDLQMFIDSAFSVEETFEGIDWQPGEIIDEQYYYRLEAFDVTGRKWIGGQFLPERSSGPHGSLVSGRFSELTLVTATSNATISSFEIHLAEKLKVPYNATTVAETMVAGEPRQKKIAREIAQFKAQSLNIEINSLQGHTVIRASSGETLITQTTIDRIYEAFQFVTTYYRDWNICRSRQNDTVYTTIRNPKRQIETSRVGPPIPLDEHVDVWNAFDRYFRFISSDTTSYRHAVSVFSHHVQESGKGTAWAHALVLSVVIESLLAEFFPGYSLPQPGIVNNSVAARSAIAGCADIDDNYKNRLMGMISATTNTRAIDILYNLIDAGLISADLRKNYRDVRNKTAHGCIEPKTGPDLQNLIDASSNVLVLFYHLVFIKIGYEGKYVDYGAYGFPRDHFGAES